MAELLDVKTALQTVLVQKQEAVRDFQSYASRINNPEISKLFSHFAEAEAIQATQIKDKLDQLS